MTSKRSLCVRSDMKNLTAIREFLTAATESLHLEEDVAFALQMAVDEACANVIEHAYEGRMDGILCVSCYRSGDSMVVTICDHGKPFDPDSIRRPDISAPLDKRGDEALGLYLMERLMDSVQFRFDPVAGNKLTMKKRIRSGKPSLSPVS